MLADTDPVARAGPHSSGEDPSRSMRWTTDQRRRLRPYRRRRRRRYRVLRRRHRRRHRRGRQQRRRRWSRRRPARSGSRRYGQGDVRPESGFLPSHAAWLARTDTGRPCSEETDPPTPRVTGYSGRRSRPAFGRRRAHGVTETPAQGGPGDRRWTIPGQPARIPRCSLVSPTEFQQRGPTGSARATTPATTEERPAETHAETGKSGELA